MKVLSISTDRKIFEKGSAVGARMLLQANFFDELHIVVPTLKKQLFKEMKVGENVWAYPTNSRSKFFYIREMAALSEKILHEKKLATADTVITCQDPFETGTVGVRLKRKYGLKLQLQIHTDFMSPYFRKESFRNRIRVRLAKKNLPEADEVRVVSERIRRSLGTLGIPHEKIDVLPIVVDAGKFEKEPSFDLHKKYPEFTFIMLVASRLTHEKNIGSALRILRKIVNIYPKAGMVIVGEGPELDHLKKLSQKLGLEKSVRFEMWQKDLNPYYRTSHAFLLTSLYEGYGLSVIEAGLCGAAIVMPDVGIAGDIIKDGKNGMVCPVNDEICFSQNLLKLIAHNERREAMRRQIAEDAPRAIIRNADDYMRQYKALLEKTLSHTP